MTIHPCFALTANTNVVSEHGFKNFLKARMADGSIHYAPKPEIVGHGLDKVQAAVDRLAKGVSAKKLVVTLG